MFYDIFGDVFIQYDMRAQVNQCIEIVPLTNLEKCTLAFMHAGIEVLYSISCGNVWVVTSSIDHLHRLVLKITAILDNSSSTGKCGLLP
jgi:hypothetical protein